MFIDDPEGSKRFIAMDGLKNKVSLEIQLGKYAFALYDVLCKMPLFKKQGMIESGICVFIDQSIRSCVSTGPASLQQVKALLKMRGSISDGVPIAMLGIG